MSRILVSSLDKLSHSLYVYACVETRRDMRNGKHGGTGTREKQEILMIFLRILVINNRKLFNIC